MATLQILILDRVLAACACPTMEDPAADNGQSTNGSESNLESMMLERAHHIAWIIQMDSLLWMLKENGLLWMWIRMGNHLWMLIIGLRLLVLMIILLFDPSLGANFICNN